MKKTAYYTEFDVPAKLSNRELLKILNFYVLHSPVPKVSCRGKTFEQYGFRGNKAFAALKRQMMESASPSLKENYKPSKKRELECNFQSVENASPPMEYCVFLKSDEKTVMNSLFKAIRNAFAHGSFNVKSYNGVRIYFLLNDHDGRKAQIVLQEKTLLNWIGIVKAGYRGSCEAKK